jgi:hypothetical protein
MNMTCPRFALRLLSCAGSSATREALIGDLLEEIDRGRSRWWLCQQLIGLCGVALVAHARDHVRPTPPLVALALTMTLLGGASIASLSRVLETWLAFYLVAGTVSLFAHMGFRTNDSRRSVIPADVEAPIAG